MPNNSSHSTRATTQATSAQRAPICCRLPSSYLALWSLSWQGCAPMLKLSAVRGLTRRTARRLGMVSSGCGGGRAVARACAGVGPWPRRFRAPLPGLVRRPGRVPGLLGLRWWQSRGCFCGSRLGPGLVVTLGWSVRGSHQAGQSPCAVTSDPTMSIWSTEGLYRAESLIAASAPKPMVRMV